MRPGQVALVGLLLAVFALEAVGQLSFSPPEEGFWVNADEGWWTDVVILADGSGPPDFLRALEPDALNWCHWELPMFLAELGTKRVGSTHLGYQESLERAQGDLAGWKWTHALAYNVYDRPVYYGDWGGSYFMDPHAPEWADAVLAGIRESLSGADGVSQDNIGVPPFIKGQCGFSPREKAEFRAFLAENVSESALQPLGVDPSTLDIAAYIRQHDYTDGSALAETDPIYRAFVLYQYVSNLQIWRDMLDDIGIHELPDKIIHGNQYGVWSVWDSSPYPLLLSQLHQVIEIEYVSYLQAIPPGVRDSLLYKLGLASGNQEKPVWIRGIVYDWHRGESVLRTNHLRLLTASAYANGAVRTFEHGQGTPSGYSEMPAEAEASLLQYYGWLDEVRFLFERRRSAANVAIVYSIPTMMWRFFPATGHWNSSQIGSLSGFADLLERNHIPYDALIFGHPAVWDDAGLAERMAAYDLLILPDVDCISLEQISALQAFLEQGGRILCTGDVGLYDEDLEARPSSVLADVLMSPDTFCLTGTPAQEYFQQGVARQDQASVRSEQAILTAAIRAAMGTEHIVETDAPETVCVNVFQTRDEGFSVHLLNLDYDEMGDLLTPSDSLVLRIRPPAISITAGPVWFFADDGTASALASELDDGWIEVRVPPFQSHAIIHIGSLSEHAKAAIEAAGDSMAANRWVHGDPLIDTLLEQARTALDAENALDALSYCAELERLITSRTARVAYDFSHAQQAALDWESAHNQQREPRVVLARGACRCCHRPVGLGTDRRRRAAGRARPGHCAAPHEVRHSGSRGHPSARRCRRRASFHWERGTHLSHGGSVSSVRSRVSALRLSWRGGSSLGLRQLPRGRHRRASGHGGRLSIAAQLRRGHDHR